MRLLLALFLLIPSLASISQALSSGSTNKTTSGEFMIEPPTLICASFEWMIEGDENRNAMVSVAFRKKDYNEWQKGLPLLRIGGEKIYGHDQPWVYTTPSMFAGSIFYLEPNTTYECKFHLIDPDGVQGSIEQVAIIKTKAEPKPYENGRVFHV